VFRSLLVCFDGSSHAQLALREAVDLAHGSDGRLTILTVVPEPSTWALTGGYPAPEALDDLAAQLERDYRHLLDSAADTVPADVPTTKLLRHGPAGPAIVEEAAGGRHDLIVMGSRGRGELRALLLGSASHHVLNTTSTPVLVVHVADDDPAPGEPPARRTES